MHIFDKFRLVKPLAAVLAMVGVFTASLTLAMGTNERERAMSRYAGCGWTDQMGKDLYECIKLNNGFNAHLCFDETVEANCKPDPLPGQAVEPQPDNEAAAAPVEENQQQARKRAARQGEENLRGTIERERTMLKYKDCKWTDEMGKYTYECVKRNNGFNTHWCYDEALQVLCPVAEVDSTM